MRNCFALGLVCGLFACAAFAADDVSSAVVATVKTVDKGAKTVVVKTADGTEHTFHFLGRTIAHGAEAQPTAPRTRSRVLKKATTSWCITR